MIRTIKSKDLSNFIDFCKNKDKYSDFYVEVDGEKRFLTDRSTAIKVFNSCLKRNNECFVIDRNDEIKGLMIVQNYDSKNFIRTLTKSKKDLQDLFNYLKWKQIPNLTIKVKSHNRNYIYLNKKTKRFMLSYGMKRSGFYIKFVNGKEIILKKKDYNRGSNK